MKIGYKTERNGTTYIKKIVDKNVINRLTTAKLLDLPFKDIDIDKDRRWNAKKINAELLQAIEQGEDISKMSERLQRVTDMNEVSAIRNARTMTTSFENLGRLDGMKAMKEDGTIIKKQWLATISTKKHKTRDWHKELSGQTAEIDEPFINHPNGDKEEIMYPGDPTASPANIWNCRCTLTYEIEGFEPTLPKGTIKVSDNELSTSREADIIARQTVLKEKIQEYSEFANPNWADIYDKIKAQKYYEYRKEYYKLQDELNNIRKAERETRLHINQIVTEKAGNKKEGRYITSGTYERAEKRLEKAILRNMGV